MRKDVSQLREDVSPLRADGVKIVEELVSIRMELTRLATEQSHFAAKADLAAVKEDVAAVRTEMAAMKADFVSDIRSVATNLKGWMLGTALTLITITSGMFYSLHAALKSQAVAAAPQAQQQLAPPGEQAIPGLR